MGLFRLNNVSLVGGALYLPKSYMLLVIGFPFFVPLVFPLYPITIEYFLPLETDAGDDGWGIAVQDWRCEHEGK